MEAPIDTELVNIILKIPKNTAVLSVEATVLKDGKSQIMKADFSPSDIFDMRMDFLDNVEAGDEYDAVYVIADEYAHGQSEADSEEHKDESHLS